MSEVVLSGERRSLSDHFQVGIAKYRANAWSDVAASACVFVPVGIVNFRRRSKLRRQAPWRQTPGLALRRATPHVPRSTRAGG